MALRFTTTDQAAFEAGVKMLVYGRAGVGKTRLCATAPAPIILSAEAGLMSIRQFKIPVIDIRTHTELTEAYEWCLRSAEARAFQTVCLDSISEIGEVVLAEAKPLFKDVRQAYGHLIDTMSQVIRNFRDLPGKHVYFSAKEEKTREDKAGVMMLRPAMPGSKVGPQLPYFFDEVFHLATGTDSNGADFTYLRTKLDWQTDAKDRSGALEVFEYPDLSNVISKIQGAPQHANT